MIVMKFGGTSLGSSDAVRRVGEIVRDAASRSPVVVVSAHAGVTDALAGLAALAPTGGADASSIVERHRTILTGLGLPPGICDSLHDELAELLRGLRLIGEASPRAIDHLLGFGERCSARIVAAFLRSIGVPATACHAGDLGLRTDSDFGRARPLPDDGRFRSNLDSTHGVPVVTGFVGRDADGHSTTLGRNGSDFSASWIGEAVAADEIQIWTDVSGVLSADPRVVPDARRIDEMRYDEAAELATFGGTVLHPAALQPAVRAGITVRVCGTAAPAGPGTRIVPAIAHGSRVVRAVVSRQPVSLITVRSAATNWRTSALADLTCLAERGGIEIVLLVSSAVSATLVTGETNPTSAFVTAAGSIGEIRVETDRALVSVVGGELGRHPDLQSAALEALGEARIEVLALGRTAGGAGLSLVVPAPQADSAVRRLHSRFFGA